MHRIDGPGATVDNEFTDGDPVGGVPATIVMADWLNDVQEELMSILSAAGITPVKGTQDQVLKAFVRFFSSQSLTAYTTGGAAPAFTLTPSPAITAYAANQRFRVKFNAAAPVSGTLNVSGQGAKILKQYDAFGVKVPAVIAAGQLADVKNDGTDFVLLDPLPAAWVGTSGSAKNLAASAVGTNAVVAITADEITVENSAGQYQVLRAVSVSANLATSGLNGLDTGSMTANTWYATYAIWNHATGAKGAIASLNYTAPLLPAGYTHWAFVTSVRVGPTLSKILPFIKRDKVVFFVPTSGTDIASDFPILVNSGTSTSFVQFSLQNFVPPNASLAKIGATHSGSVSGSLSITMGGSNASGLLAQINNNGTSITRAQFEVPDPYNRAPYYAIINNGSGTIVAMGWEE